MQGPPAAPSAGGPPTWEKEEQDPQQPWTNPQQCPACSPTPSFVPAACVAKGPRRWCGRGVTAEVETWEDEEGRKKEMHRQWDGGKRERERERERKKTRWLPVAPNFVIDHWEIARLTTCTCKRDTDLHVVGSVGAGMRPHPGLDIADRVDRSQNGGPGRRPDLTSVGYMGFPAIPTEYHGTESMELPAPPSLRHGCNLHTRPPSSWGLSDGRTKFSRPCHDGSR